jgi:hypothetical protein
MNYINITKICKKYKKQAGHFKDNKRLDSSKMRSGGVGRNSFTEIHEDLMPQFMLWLSPETRQALFQGGVKAAILIVENKDE